MKRSSTQHSFARIPQADIPRSVFNRSSNYKTTFDAGYLVPVYCDEALPGDTFNLKMTTFCRLATPLSPLMDNLYLDSFFFAVPIRLIWSNFKKFMGEQTDPGDSTDYLVPIMAAPASTGHAEGSLSDYMGIPTGVADLEHSALWHRAYNLIWNEWFRDQNLQDSVVVDKDDGPDAATDYVLLRRGKRHDYFTSCLPWPQKGDAVELPLGSTAPVTITGDGSPSFTIAGSSRNLQAGVHEGIAAITYSGAADGGGAAPVWNDPNLAATADLSSATASSINELRQAFQIQRLLERDARGGTRYIEVVLSHFGVTSDDARQARPELLGLGTTTVNVHPVAQTSEAGTTPQGNLAAYATASGTNGFKKSFTEHCVIIGLVSLRADLNYQQGLNRMFSRRTRYDFFWPALAHLGEEAVLNKEIYCDGSANDENVFGYQERYASYRYRPSLVTGAFRSNAAAPLDSWHLAQEFGSLPTLNATFIQENPPVDRVIAVNTEPHVLFDAYFDNKTARPMPTYSVPGLIDHF